MHPARVEYEMFSQKNPLVQSIGALADKVKENRQPVSPDNPFLQAQKFYADWITKSLDAYRDARDRMSEDWFHAVYGSPVVQAMAGLNGSDGEPRRKPGGDHAHKQLVRQRIEELHRQVDVGGAREAAIRALLYVRMPEGPPTNGRSPFFAA